MKRVNRQALIVFCCVLAFFVLCFLVMLSGALSEDLIRL